MTTFDDREQAFEKKFTLDQDLKFKAEARRNNQLAAWAAEKMGLSVAEATEYAKQVRRSDLEEKGDDDVFRKVRADLDAKSIPVSDAELRTAMGEFLAKAVAEIEAEKEG